MDIAHILGLGSCGWRWSRPTLGGCSWGWDDGSGVRLFGGKWHYPDRMAGRAPHATAVPVHTPHTEDDTDPLKGQRLSSSRVLGRGTVPCGYEWYCTLKCCPSAAIRRSTRIHSEHGPHCVRILNWHPNRGTFACCFPCNNECLRQLTHLHFKLSINGCTRAVPGQPDRGRSNACE